MSSHASALRYDAEAWRRLSWTLPAATAITLAALLAFLRLLAQPPAIQPPSTVAVQIVELPPAPKAAPVAPLPLPAPMPKKAVEPPKPQPRPQSAPVAPATRAPANPGTMGARALYQPMPEIPLALRHHTLDLVAVARFRVAADGSATVELIQATPEPELNAALLDALKRWRFFPALENGHPVASSVDIRIPISVR